MPRLAPPLVVSELAQQLITEDRVTFHVIASPDADLQHPLELLGRVVPPVVIAKAMRREVVVSGVRSPGAVRQHVVSLPRLAVDAAAADVTTASGFRVDDVALVRC